MNKLGFKVSKRATLKGELTKEDINNLSTILQNVYKNLKELGEPLKSSSTFKINIGVKKEDVYLYVKNIKNSKEINHFDSDESLVNLEELIGNNYPNNLTKKIIITQLNNIIIPKFKENHNKFNNLNKNTLKFITIPKNIKDKMKEDIENKIIDDEDIYGYSDEADNLTDLIFNNCYFVKGNDSEMLEFIVSFAQDFLGGSSSDYLYWIYRDVFKGLKIVGINSKIKNIIETNIKYKAVDEDLQRKTLNKLILVK